MQLYNVKSDNSVIRGEYPFHKELKEELLPLLKNYPDQQNRSTNVQATMTDWDWHRDNPRIKRLKECIIAEAYSHVNCKKIACDKAQISFKLIVDEFWANIYNKGDYTLSHDHVNPTGYQAGFGFVYFLKAKWYHPSFIFTDSGKKIRPKEGTYIIFPNHLMHHVPKNRFKETRITLSGNLTIKKS